MNIQRIRGVALIVQNSEGKILILQEYETKPHLGKYGGMFSIPMETSNPKESDYYAITRLIREELPGFNLLPENIIQSRLGIYRIVPHVWVTLYSIKTSASYLPNSKNNEVGNYQWIDPKKALNLWLRQGAWEMISNFIDGKREVLCRCCRTPQADNHDSQSSSS